MLAWSKITFYRNNYSELKLVIVLLIMNLTCIAWTCPNINFYLSLQLLYLNALTANWSWIRQLWWLWIIHLLFLNNTILSESSNRSLCFFIPFFLNVIISVNSCFIFEIGKCINITNNKMSFIVYRIASTRVNKRGTFSQLIWFGTL